MNTITHKIAMAAGQDAGNKSMRDAGRTSWNDDDWNVAAHTTGKLVVADSLRRMCKVKA